jgi:hypothetical protein
LKAKTARAQAGGARLIKVPRTAFLAFACLALASLNCLSQTTPGDPVTLLRRQIGLDNAAPNPTNPQGLRIQFQKVEKAHPTDAQAVRYRLLVPGLPQDQTYTLAVWRIGTQVAYAPGQVFANAKGLLMWHQPKPKQQDKDSLGGADEIEVDLKAARGEPIRYMLTSADGKLFIPGTIVPYPLESKQGNCRLEARLGMPDGQGLLVYIDGLAPGAAVPLESESQGEKHSPVVTADAKGHAVALVDPTVAGTNAGVVKISVAATGCFMSVEVPWGEGSYRPL